MSDLQTAMRMLNAKYPTCIQQVNYPRHKGQPNPKHGWFYLVGSIPAACYDHEAKHSHYYETEQQAIAAVLAAGADRVQGADCRWIKR